MCLLRNILRFNDVNPIPHYTITEHLLWSITMPSVRDANTISYPPHVHFPGDLSDFTESQCRGWGGRGGERTFFKKMCTEKRLPDLCKSNEDSFVTYN